MTIQQTEGLLWIETRLIDRLRTLEEQQAQALRAARPLWMAAAVSLSE